MSTISIGSNVLIIVRMFTSIIHFVSRQTRNLEVPAAVQSFVLTENVMEQSRGQVDCRSGLRRGGRNLSQTQHTQQNKSYSKINGDVN